MKVVFLDIDGVLNSDAWLKQQTKLRKQRGRPISFFDPAAVSLVRGLVEQTGSKVVLSSAWRISHSLEDIKWYLADAGWPDAPLIDKTPIHRRITFGEVAPFNRRLSRRGDEVAEWLNLHPVESFAVLDDWAEFYSNQNFVQTDPKVGLTQKDVAKALKFLSEKS